MQYTYGLNYLTKSSINIINGIPIIDVWILTSDGLTNIYSNYVWTKTGIWNKDWIYTANI